MSEGRRERRSDLFLLRVWREEAGDGSTMFRGNLQRTSSGEQHQFGSLNDLADLVAELLDSTGGNRRDNKLK